MDKGDGRKDSTISSSPSLTIDRAAFLLLRVKRVFRKKKQQRKEKSIPHVDDLGHNNEAKIPRKRPPLVRSRTLPAIVVPGLNILQAQIESKYKEDINCIECSHKSHSFSYHHYLGNAEWPLNYHRLSSPEPTVGFRDDLKISSPRHSNAGFSKFSKFLNSTNKNQDNCSISLGSERRHSWERDTEDDEFDTSSLPRSASIDSIVETKHCVSLVRRLPSPLLHRCPASPPPRPQSPNTSRRLKSRRALSCKSK